MGEPGARINNRLRIPGICSVLFLVLCASTWFKASGLQNSKDGSDSGRPAV